MGNQENRTQPRVGKLYFIAYINREEGEQKSPVSLGRTLNISATGVGMEVYQAVSVDSSMEMEIGLEKDNLSIKGKVMHVTDLGNGKYYIGIKFDEIQEKLASLVISPHP
jgi:c-di-GMP-binding flagellar brake protein YcgR